MERESLKVAVVVEEMFMVRQKNEKYYQELNKVLLDEKANK